MAGSSDRKVRLDRRRPPLTALAVAAGLAVAVGWVLLPERTAPPASDAGSRVAEAGPTASPFGSATPGLAEQTPAVPAKMQGTAADVMPVASAKGTGASAPEADGEVGNIDRPENAALRHGLARWQAMSEQAATPERQALASELLDTVSAKLDQRLLSPVEATLMSMALLKDAEPDETLRKLRILQLQGQLLAQVVVQ